MSHTVSLSVLGLCGGPDVPIHHRTDHDRATLLNDYNTRKTSVDSTVSNISSDYSDIEFADSTREDVMSTCSSSSSSSSSTSSSGELITANGDDDSECQEIVRKIIHTKRPMRVAIKLLVTNNTYSVWETVLNPTNNTLYVALPDILAPEASKHSFISLLEFAEDKLEVDAVVLCMSKNRSDRSRLVKTFLMLGFQPLARNSKFTPPHHNEGENNLFLVYNIEEE